MKGIYGRPWAIVAVIGAITVFFALQIPRARLENNNMRFVPANDPAKVLSNSIDEEFGNQNKLLIGFKRDFGTVLTPDFVSRLRQFEERARLVDNVEKTASIASASYIDGVGDQVSVSPLVGSDFGGTEAEVAALRDRLASWDSYRRSLVSDDYASTQMMVTVNVPSGEAGSNAAAAVYKELSRIAAETFPDTRVYFAGTTVLNSNASTAMKKDMALLFPLVLLVVAAILLASFRKPGGVALPLATTIVATVWSMGAMPLFDIPLSIISIVLPVILIAVGSAYGIHIVSHYFDDVAGGKRLTKAEHAEAVVAVVKKIRFPVFLAALTTFAGFVSFCFTSVVPVREFGIFASFGVLAAFAIAVTFIPAVLIIAGPGKKEGGAKGTDKGNGDRFSTALTEALMRASRKRGAIIAVSCAIAAASIVGVRELVIDNVMVEYFKDENEVVLADRFIREEFGGSKTVSVVVSDETPGAVLRPDVLAAMDGLARYLEREVPEVGKTMSFTDMIKRVNQVVNADSDPAGLKGAALQTASDSFGFSDFAADGSVDAASVGSGAATADVPGSDAARSVALTEEGLARLLESSRSDPAGVVDGYFRAINYKGAAYYEIPTDAKRYGKESEEELSGLISNYLLLLSSGDFSAYANDPIEPTSIRMNIQLRTVGQIDTDRAIGKIREYVAARFPSDVSTVVGGKALVESSLNVRIVQSQLISVFASLAMVLLFLTVSYRSVAAGLIGLIPLSVSILVDFAVMGFAGIKLNIGTSMVASISVGIGIDYTIHCIDAFRRESAESNGIDECMRRAFASSGKAIAFNAVSVALGFAVLVASRFTILSNLGAIVAVSMVTSALASLTLLPALLAVARPSFIFQTRRRMPAATIELASEAHV